MTDAETNSAPRKAAAYLRVSTDNQAMEDSFGLPAQKEAILAYARTQGIEIVSVSEPVSGKDPMNTAFRQLMGVFAQLEKSMITMRMSGGRKQKALGGGYSGGRAALGYISKRGAKKLRIDKIKALAVKRTFELREQHPEWSLRQLAERLNEEGHTTAQGKQFKPIQVKRILDREEFYSEIYSYDGIEAKGKHRAII